MCRAVAPAADLAFVFFAERVFFCGFIAASILWSGTEDLARCTAIFARAVTVALIWRNHRLTPGGMARG
jgi:hypothetical protein